MTPRTWYTSMELRQETQDYERITKKFAHTFEFADEHHTIDAAHLYLIMWEHIPQSHQNVSALIMWEHIPQSHQNVTALTSDHGRD